MTNNPHKVRSGMDFLPRFTFCDQATLQRLDMMYYEIVSCTTLYQKHADNRRSLVRASGCRVLSYAACKQKRPDPRPGRMRDREKDRREGDRLKRPSGPDP